VVDFSARNTHVVAQFRILFSAIMGIIRVLNFSFNIRRFPAHVPVSETSIIRAGQFVMN